MRAGSHPIFLAIFLFVLAPVAAAVIIAVSLLLGVPPRIVFSPGLAAVALLDNSGFHPANRVAVIGTVAVLWAIIAIVGLAWERRQSAIR